MANFDRDFQPADPALAEEMFAQPQGGQLAAQGQTTMQIAGGFITAQKVAVERDEIRILGKLKILAKTASTDYFYAWTTKNRDNTKGEVSGPTIKLANDVMRVYGNCVVSVDVRNSDTHHIFAARITDLESGASMTRLFQQRKNQNTGMKDKERQEDIIFQIGQSKSIRNVIANFLSTFVDYALEEARTSLVEKFGKDIAGSRDWIAGKIENMKIPQELVERYVGRTLPEWTAKDVAKVVGTLQAIHDGMVSVDDVFPSGATPSAVGEAAAKAPAPPPPPKPAEAPAAETKEPAPEPSTAQETPSPEKEKPKAKKPPTPPSPTPEPSSTSEPEPSPSPSLIDDSSLDETSTKLRKSMIAEIQDLPDTKGITPDKMMDSLIAIIKGKDERTKNLSPEDYKAVKAVAKELLETLM